MAPARGFTLGSSTVSSGSNSQRLPSKRRMPKFMLGAMRRNISRRVGGEAGRKGLAFPPGR